MHPCLPSPIPFLPGCVVRRVEELHPPGMSRYCLTYWYNGRAYQTTVETASTPELLGVMTHFDRFPEYWTAVSAPVSKTL